MSVERPGGLPEQLPAGLPEGLFDGVEALALVQEDAARTGWAYTAYLEGAALPAAAENMLKAGYFLEDVSALDAEEGFVVSYFFDHTGTPGRLCLRALVHHDAPSIPTITATYRGADWHEREAADFYGINFVGHPNLLRLLLPSDMNSAPLRKQPAARAPARTLFCGGSGTFVSKQPGFTLLDAAPEPAGTKTAEGPAEAGASDAASQKG